jgi:hypothetical protein
MSNVAIFNPSANVPAFLRNHAPSAVAKALMGGAAQTGKRISIKGSVFRLVVDGKEVAAMDERFLDVVIVNAAPKVSRTFYQGTYEDANPTPPVCWSQDGDLPDKSIKAPQGASCAQCPQNVSGSGQGQSRACRYSQRLAVLLANDMDGDVMQLSLAATSLFGKAEGDNRPLQEYSRWMAAQGADPTAVVTRMKFDTKVATPKLFFKPMRWLEDDEYEAAQVKGTSPEALAAITMTVSQTDAVSAPAPMPFAGTPPKARAAAPAPAAADEDEAEPPAPAPRKAKPTPMDDEAEAPAPKPRAKAKPAPLPAEPDDEAEPVVRAAAPKAQTNVPQASGVAKALAEWDDE